ncbi:trp RNA-binding attenuation protein MtrB [Paenibacillus sp. HN-1]|uniref:trp RNA-binding attenuation protein MtrB n=1 Tax=Paenibacillus TaxID=44249 RepID=UPI001CA984EB|nr:MULTISPECIES: trp RNA-binding attenuation protein MtrB [Paenibacillus]MBY9081644.1 trp RNA-binding attenuation protein MtrB [Paenibacillus sp. CGMCC 1.18879]MBY9083513.1 trp RNA-binding attenuation protein MtrB [Paenibacillus sinensis]
MSDSKNEGLPDPSDSDYIVIKAKENGVQVMGLTRGTDTRFHHTEKLDKGEVYIAQFTDHTSAMKIRGKAEIMTKHGQIESGI